MLKTASEEFKISFLLEFTRKLIENHSPLDVIKLRKRIDEEEESFKIQLHKEKVEQKQQIKQAVKNDNSYDSNIFRTTPQGISQRQPFIKPLPTQKRILRIPEPRLPPHLQYLKPDFSRPKKELDLGKLNPLIQDPSARDIIVNGADMEVMIKTSFKTKKTDIILSANEIEDIISRFSEASKIPANEGLFRVAYGPLIINAIISKVTGSRFIIKKINYNRFFK